MSAIALVGGVTALLPRRILDRLLVPLVSFAAGSLLGGAFFHLIPEGVAASGGASIEPYLWVVLGFTLFLVLEQGLRWHHSHGEAVPEGGGDDPGAAGGSAEASTGVARGAAVAASGPTRDRPRPQVVLILLGDGLHNLLGGLAVGAAFTLDVRLGIAAWLAAAAHEIPQELGDFAVLVQGGMERRQALAWNLVSALTFPVGALLAWGAAFRVEVVALLPFAAGNFIYIAASDLIPEIKARPGTDRGLVHVAMFVLGVVLLYVMAGGGGHG